MLRAFSCNDPKQLFPIQSRDAKNEKEEGGKNKEYTPLGEMYRERQPVYKTRRINSLKYVRTLT